MSMLAEPKTKKKMRITPRSSIWSKDDNKLGQKIMEKMGWNKDKGLGKNEQGMKNPVRPKANFDSRGVGYEGNPDRWVQHYDAFEDVLASLNTDNYVNKDNECRGPEEDTVKIESLELRSKKSKSRVHYSKFTRGKDLSRYNEEDLACVLGSKLSDKKKAKAREKEERESCSDVGNVNRSYGLMSVHGGSIKDYFNQKMEQLKQKREEGILGGSVCSGVSTTSGTPNSNKTTTNALTPLPDLNFEPEKTDFSFNLSIQSDTAQDEIDGLCYSGDTIGGCSVIETKTKSKKSKKRKQDKDDKYDVEGELDKEMNEQVETETKSKKSKKRKQDKDDKYDVEGELDKEMNEQIETETKSNKSKKRKQVKDDEYDVEGELDKEESIMNEQLETKTKSKKNKKNKRKAHNDDNVNNEMKNKDELENKSKNEHDKVLENSEHVDNSSENDDNNKKKKNKKQEIIDITQPEDLTEAVSENSVEETSRKSKNKQKKNEKSTIEQEENELKIVEEKKKKKSKKEKMEDSLIEVESNLIEEEKRTKCEENQMMVNEKKKKKLKKEMGDSNSIIEVESNLIEEEKQTKCEENEIIILKAKKKKEKKSKINQKEENEIETINQVMESVGKKKKKESANDGKNSYEEKQEIKEDHNAEENSTKELRKERKRKRNQMNESYLAATSPDRQKKRNKKEENAEDTVINEEKSNTHEGKLKKMKKFASEITVGDIFRSNSNVKKESSENKIAVKVEPTLIDLTDTKKQKKKLTSKKSFKELTNEIGGKIEKLREKFKNTDKKKLKPIQENIENEEIEMATNVSNADTFDETIETSDVTIKLPKTVEASDIVTVQLPKRETEWQTNYTIYETKTCNLAEIFPGSNLSSIKGYDRD